MTGIRFDFQPGQMFQTFRAAESEDRDPGEADDSTDAGDVHVGAAGLMRPGYRPRPPVSASIIP